MAPCEVCCACRTIRVNLKVSSSSLFSLSMKLGEGPVEKGSGSCDRSASWRNFRRVSSRYHTWTYSTILLSPRSRFAVSLVAGKALGTTFRTVRLRELVTDRDEIVTNASITISTHDLASGRTILTSSLVPQIHRSALVGPAANVAHLQIYSLLPNYPTKAARSGSAGEQCGQAQSNMMISSI